MEKHLKKHKHTAYVIFRVFIGLLFFQHGAQKILGWFGAQTASFPSLFFWAGIIELVGGVLIIIGLFTIPAAFISAITMAVAYFKVHFPSGWVPISNKGELALVYFAAFIVLATYGSGKFSLDNWRKKRKQATTA